MKHSIVVKRENDVVNFGRVTFAPEVEAKRADFEVLADALAVMVTLEADRVPKRLDISSSDDNPLCRALLKHFDALPRGAELDWFDPYIVRCCYVDQRLRAEQNAWEERQAASLPKAA